MIFITASLSSNYNVKQMRKAYDTCHNCKTALTKSICYAQQGFKKVKEIRKIEEYIPVINKLEDECGIILYEVIEK